MRVRASGSQQRQSLALTGTITGSPTHKHNEMSLLAFEKYKKSDFVDVAYFEPFYLKDFVLNK